MIVARLTVPGPTCLGCGHEDRTEVECLILDFDDYDATEEHLRRHIVETFHVDPSTYRIHLTRSEVLK